MGNTQTNEVKTKMGKPHGKVKTLIKIRGKRGGKTDDVPFSGVVPDDENEKKNNTTSKEQIYKEEFKISPTIGESSSDSIFTDPLTPVGISTEINECYRSDENIHSKNNLLECPSNNFKLYEFKLKKEEEVNKKISKLGLSKISQISLDCDSRDCFVSENVVCVQEDNSNSSRFLDEQHQEYSEQSAGFPECKDQTLETTTTSEIKEEGLVLKRVVSLTLDKEALENKVCKPKFVPEKLDFKLYEKFEGHMLINWYLSEFHHNCHLSKLLQNQDLKLLATQFCTHLLAAGVLHQIPDKDVPMYNIFKPDLMYYWAHSETPASVPQTPGRLNSLSWPPTSPCPSDVFTPTSIINSEITTEEKNVAQKAEVLALEEERTRLKQDIERYHTLIEIQTLTTNAIKDFDSPSKTEHFICDKCGSSTNYLNDDAQLLNDLAQNGKQKYEASTPNNSFHAEAQESNCLTESSLPQLLTDTPIKYKSALESDYAPLHVFDHYKTPPPNNSPLHDFTTILNESLPELCAITPPQLYTSKSNTSLSLSSITKSPDITPTPPPLTAVTDSPTLIVPTLSAFVLANDIPSPTHLQNKIPTPLPPPFDCGDSFPIFSVPIINGFPTSSPLSSCETTTLHNEVPLPSIPLSSSTLFTTTHIPPLPPSPLPPPPPPLPSLHFACATTVPSSHSRVEEIPLSCARAPPPPPPPPPLGGTVYSSLQPPGFEGIPPPPPLLAGIPLPLPTPPTGGWVSTKSTLNKEAVTPKIPMKPLYWTRIVVPQVDLSAKPIWSQVEELKLKNLSEFSNLFSRQVIQKSVPKKKVKSKTKIEPVKMLDSKRSQNVGILAQSLHVDFTEIENAIYTFDTSIVSLEALQQIYEIRATPEELHQIQQHLEQKPDIPLDKPEQFLYDLSEISNFPERISCFMFQIEFDDSITNIENTLTNIKSICNFLTDNRSLIKVLSIILTLGNYMNGGNITRGQADGYGLEILSKLKDVKSNDAQVTLLHFIVRTYMNEFDYIILMEMPLPVPDSEDIRKAASVNFDEVGADLQVLDKNLKACENRIKKVLETAANDNIEPFQGKMKSFVSNAKDQLQTQLENMENCKTKFVSTMKMYQFKSKSQTSEATPLSDFFDLWYLFCKDFKDIWKKELARREKEKKYELKVKEALRNSEIVRVDIKPNSIKEKVRKLVQEEMN